MRPRSRAVVTWCCGSSPRPWGTPAGLDAKTGLDRFIPTPVGNTPTRSPTTTLGTVHPHARGEHELEHSAVAVAAGSSPRPWGTPDTGAKQRGLRRFIPTPVGNTHRVCRAVGVWPVHPHARGEHRLVPQRADLQSGSSPRPWGTPDSIAQPAAHRRFIPTPVGNTIQPSRRAARSSVHPHARGEHLRLPRETRGVDGSSPRPWGTHDERREHRHVARFIPTPVGNTSGSIPRPTVWTVHPHARGEHIVARRIASPATGSSPRPWGTQGLQAYVRAAGRFIPTPVGNTSSSTPHRTASTVHPHARGEHTKRATDALGVVGSSPRPWGTHRCGRERAGRARFIPTPVGNTTSFAMARRSIAVHPHARGEHERCELWPVLSWRFIPTPVGNTPWCGQSPG